MTGQKATNRAMRRKQKKARASNTPKLKSVMRQPVPKPARQTHASRSFAGASRFRGK